MVSPFLALGTVRGTCPQLDNAVFAHLAPLEILVRPSASVRPSVRPGSGTCYLLMIRHRIGNAVCLICRSYWGNIAGHKFTAFECCEEETLYDRVASASTASRAARRVKTALRMKTEGVERLLEVPADMKNFTRLQETMKREVFPRLFYKFKYPPSLNFPLPSSLLYVVCQILFSQIKTRSAGTLIVSNCQTLTYSTLG